MKRLWCAIWILSAVLLGSAAPVQPRVLDHIPWEKARKQYHDIVAQAAFETKIPFSVIDRVIWCESGYYPRAVGHNPNGTRDLGICQLNSRYLDHFAQAFNGGRPIDPFDPEQAIPVAAKLLADHFQTFGNWYDAVAAYNCGAWAVRNRRIPESTVLYVAKVMGP